jgi:hypothetical protein
VSVIAGKEFPVRDCGKKRPQIRRVMQSGHVLYDRPPVVPHLCAIDPAGFIVDVPLHNGGANAAPEEPYRSFIEARKRQVGFIPADRCPLSEGHRVRRLIRNLIPGLADREVCKTAEWELTIRMGDPRPVWVKVAAKPGKERPADGVEIFPRNRFCLCVKEIAEARRAAHERIEAGRKDAATTIAELQAKATQSQADSAARTNEAVVQVLDRLSRMIPGASAAMAPEVPAAPTAAPAEVDDEEGDE